MTQISEYINIGLFVSIASFNSMRIGREPRIKSLLIQTKARKIGGTLRIESLLGLAS